MTSDFRRIAPPIKDLSDLTIPSLDSSILSSGMQVTTHQCCDVDICRITLLIEGGKAEAPSTAVAVLAAGLVNEGTSSFDNATIADILDRNGAWLTTDTHNHHQQLNFFSLNSRLSEILPVITEIIMSPAYPADIVKTRTEILARNIEVSQRDVMYMAHCLSDKMVMGENHPLARVDTPDNILALKSDDLLNFHRDYHSANASRLYICGNLTTKIEQQIIDACDRLPISAKQQHLVNVPFSPLPPLTTHTTTIADATQSAVVINIPSISRNHPDYLPLNLTVFALGGYFSSRLMANIREEKGLTYGIRSSLYGYAESSAVEISAQTDPTTVEKLINEVRNELTNLKINPPCGEELARIKRAAAAEMRSSLDNPFGPTQHSITTVTANLPHNYFQNKVQAISALTSDTIAQMAEKYLQPDTMLTAICGPQNNYQ